MLSAKLTTPIFPYLASPKLDGIRCVVLNGVALSRTLKPIPNKHIQSILGDAKYNGYDGEIICGNPSDPACFRNTTTVVMSHDKVEDFTFHVFDTVKFPNDPFEQRINCVNKDFVTLGLSSKTMTVVPHTLVSNQQEFDDLEGQFLEQGYEGMMVRSLSGRYKYGRATTKENILSKVKRFSDSEAIVIGVEELMHNDNEKSVNELGRSKRSSHQENKRPAGVMGALIVKDVVSGIEFNVGTGFDTAQREQIWKDRDTIIGKQFTYKSFHIGVKEKPRHPVFKGWRVSGF